MRTVCKPRLVMRNWRQHTPAHHTDTLGCRRTCGETMASGSRARDSAISTREHEGSFLSAKHVTSAPLLGGSVTERRGAGGAGRPVKRHVPQADFIALQPHTHATAAGHYCRQTLPSSPQHRTHDIAAPLRL
jgi:hypothetical protein